MAPITQIVWRVSRFVVFPVLFCDAGPTLRDPLWVWGPSLCSPRFVAMVFLNAMFVHALHVFACFCNISFVFYIILHVYALCVVCCLVACVGTMRGAWYWYACHASHHHRVFIIMFIIIVMIMIIDHHHVHHSLFIVQSLNVDR